MSDWSAQIDWIRVRSLIQEAKKHTGLNPSQLAKLAGFHRSILSKFLGSNQPTLQPETVARLYQALAPRIPIAMRREFLKEAGIERLISMLDREPHLLVGLGDTEHLAGRIRDPHRLMALGSEVGIRSWEDASLIFLAAEQSSPRQSALAGLAGVAAVQQLVNLGDYERAVQGVERIEETYRRTDDPYLAAEQARIRGWIAYYRGEFTHAEASFRECIRISEVTADPRLSQGAHHFLGRLYGDWAPEQHDKARTDQMFEHARRELQTAHEAHLAQGLELNEAYDLVRMAQISRAAGENEDDIAKMIKDARGIFGSDHGALHLDLEEARIKLLRDHPRSSMKLAERALEGWLDLKYAKGIAEALVVIGRSAFVDLHLSEAFEAYASALFIHPYHAQPRFGRVWREMLHIKHSLQQRSKAEMRWDRRTLIERVKERRGQFRYLDFVHADRSKQISVILGDLDIDGAEGVYTS